jgi:hypothetical protein
MSVSRIALFARRGLPRRAAALAGLAAMLFAQAALALAACGLDARMSSRAFVHAMTAAAEPGEPCHEEAPANDAFCAAHCQASEQTLDKYQGNLPLPPVHLLPVFPIRVLPYRAVRLPPDPMPAAAPPARVLFQSFLI